MEEQTALNVVIVSKGLHREVHGHANFQVVSRDDKKGRAYRCRRTKDCFVVQHKSEAVTCIHLCNAIEPFKYRRVQVDSRYVQTETVIRSHEVARYYNGQVVPVSGHIEFFDDGCDSDWRGIQEYRIYCPLRENTGIGEWAVAMTCCTDTYA